MVGTRDRSEGRFAGVRTFTLLGILSGISGWLWINHFELLAAILLAAAGALVVAAYAAASRHDVEATTEVAALVVLTAGVAAGIGSWALAAGAIAVITLLLVEKSRIHDIARKVDDTSLRAAVRFGVMAVVILPLLPEGPFGPGAGFRPRTLWLAVLIFSGLSFAGYLARKSLSGTLGYPVAGVLGGPHVLDRSDVLLLPAEPFAAQGSRTTGSRRHWSMHRSLSARPCRHRNAELRPGLCGRSLLCYSFRCGTRRDRSHLAHERHCSPTRACRSAIPCSSGIPSRWPLCFRSSSMMHWLEGSMGDQGLLISGAILGLTDVDALTISMARGVQTTDWTIAAKALCIGIVSNTLLKTVVALILGQGRFRLLTAAGLVGIGIATLLPVLLR